MVQEHDFAGRGLDTSTAFVQERLSMSDILRRCAALLSASALIGALTTAPALAEDFSRVDRDPVMGSPVVLEDGREAETALFSLRVADEDSVRAYPMLLDEEVRPRTAYVESEWTDTPHWTGTSAAPNPADRANWIVSNSYPNESLPSLALASGLPFVEGPEAIAATQAALWNVLDGTELDEESNSQTVLRLYDHLVEGSRSAETGATARSLEVTPNQLEAVAPEEPLGPLTVSVAGGGSVQASLRGAPASWLVDADGREISTVEDGEDLYLAVDPSVPAGVATLHLRGDKVPLEEGRLFTGREGVRTQPLITAEPGVATSATSATLTWNGEKPPESEVEDEEEAAPPVVDESEPPPPEEDTATEPPEASPTATDGDDRNQEKSGLAITGTWLSGLLVIAGALVVSGLLILVLGRKRRD
ncbi:thioester domain-containing protein [Nocardiopsis alba]|uniref:thioester domain-containing protein n=1 Tax=Nocardiopsis alba TaxID=53437 RepID=UPI0033E3E226